MRAMTAIARSGLSVSTALVLAAGLAATNAIPAKAAGGSGLTGSCNPYVAGTLIPVPCFADSASGGGSGGPITAAGGASMTNSCAATVLDMAQAQKLGLSWPPPTGHSWALVLCLAGVLGAGPQAVLVNTATGVPAITPQQLLVTAYGELRIPHLTPSTAPPRGRSGLVGLPEWFWIAASAWHARTVTVAAGPVWATVTATPVGLTFRAGPGLSPVTCTGPGTPYNPSEQSTPQHTDCSYTYLRPSTDQPGDAYTASVTVTWRVIWIGSGGAGGLLDAALPVSASFTIPVAQGEALVTTP